MESETDSRDPTDGGESGMVCHRHASRILVLECTAVCINRCDLYRDQIKSQPPRSLRRKYPTKTRIHQYRAFSFSGSKPHVSHLPLNSSTLHYAPAGEYPSVSSLAAPLAPSPLPPPPHPCRPPPSPRSSHPQHSHRRLPQQWT